MSLIKQLWIAVAAVTLLAFGGSMIISTLSARDYVEQQLQVMNNDTANSLALSLSQMPKDDVTVELQISAQFDTGHYQLINLRDPFGSTMIERSQAGDGNSAPDWFKDLVRLNPRAGIAQVQDGWQQFGTITVQSHSGFAYSALWERTLMLLFWFLAGAALVGAFGTWLLKRITRPLHGVVEQARAIGERRFITTTEPRTTEFRSVVRAMNRLSQRVNTMLSEESRRLDEMRRQNQHDELTGLLNRQQFLNVLDMALGDPEASPRGALAVIRIENLIELNREIGRERTDKLLIDITERLQSLVDGSPKSATGRLNGSDFALLRPGQGRPDELAAQLSATLEALAAMWQTTTPPRLRLGIAGYANEEARPTVLARTDGALAAAEQNKLGSLGIHVAQIDEQRPALDNLTDWRKAISDALATEQARLAFYPVVSCQNELLHFEAPLRLQLADEWYRAGSFLPWAERLELTSRIDLLAVRTALTRIRQTQDPVGINLSASSLDTPDFVDTLKSELIRHPNEAGRLYLEMPEYGVVAKLAQFRDFCSALGDTGSHIGIEHAGRQFNRLGGLHDLGLNYLKIDGSLTRDIARDTGNQSFVNGLCVLAHTIGLQVIAEGVGNDEDRATLCRLGIDGVTGPGITHGN